MKMIPFTYGRRRVQAPRSSEPHARRRLVHRVLLLLAIPALLLAVGCNPPGTHGFLNGSQYHGGTQNPKR